LCETIFIITLFIIKFILKTPTNSLWFYVHNFYYITTTNKFWPLMWNLPIIHCANYTIAHNSGSQSTTYTWQVHHSPPYIPDRYITVHHTYLTGTSQSTIHTWQVHHSPPYIPDRYITVHLIYLTGTSLLRIRLQPVFNF
jgi:hypothetical protein